MGLLDIAGIYVTASLIRNGRIENPFTPGVVGGLERAADNLYDFLHPVNTASSSSAEDNEDADDGYTPENAAAEAAEMAELNTARVCETVLATCEALDDAGTYEAVFEFSPWAILDAQDSWEVTERIGCGFPDNMTPEGYPVIEKPQGLNVARRAYWALVDQLYLASVAYSVAAYFEGIDVAIYDSEHDGYWAVGLAWEPDQF